MASHFVWYELMTTDMAGAEAFYKAVIGWKPEHMPGMPYTIMKVGDTGVAGMMTIPEEAQGDGAASSLDRLHLRRRRGRADGKRVKAARRQCSALPKTSPRVGRFSVVADPQGAVFMLFQAGRVKPALSPSRHAGHVGWRELYAEDWEKRIRLLRQPVRLDEGPGHRHGRDGNLSVVRDRRPAGRRNDGQAG